MEVIGIEPRPEHELPYVELHTPDELDAVLPRADFVISTVPHTPETEGTFNAERFKLMKSSAYFINVGRGKVCRIDDLADAIESGRDRRLRARRLRARAPALRPQAVGPSQRPDDAPRLPQWRREHPDRRFQVMLDNTRRFLSGQPLNNVVDKSKWY